MPWVDVLIVIGAAIVILALLVVIRANRRDEKDVWKPPKDFEDPDPPMSGS